MAPWSLGYWMSETGWRIEGQRRPRVRPEWHEDLLTPAWLQPPFRVQGAMRVDNYTCSHTMMVGLEDESATIRSASGITGQLLPPS